MKSTLSVFCALLTLQTLVSPGLTRVLEQTAQISRNRWSWYRFDLAPDGMPQGRPLNIAHRGSSGMYPEHTELAYEKAAEQGADYVECDVVVTKDLKLICSHEPWMSEVSNVNSNEGPFHPDFSSRKATYNMDDDDPNFNWNDKGDIEDFFTFDFTLDEIKTLRRKQARDYRDPLYDWQEGFVTFEEFLQLSRMYQFGIYPEIKHGAAINKILQDRGHTETMESLILKDLEKYNYTSAEDPCLIQAFELTTLRNIKKTGSDLRLIFLLGKMEKTTDDDLDMYQAEGFHGLGLDKDLLTIKDNTNHIERNNSELIQKVHDRGMKVHAFTFRNEYRHLPWDDGQDPYAEYQRYLDMGIDGYFTDFPDSLRRFLEAKSIRHKMQENSANVLGSEEVNVILLGALSLCNFLFI